MDFHNAAQWLDEVEGCSMNMQVTDWAEHYKAVRRRISQAAKARPDAEFVRQTPEQFIARELAKIAKPSATQGVTRYLEPIGPIKVNGPWVSKTRDWLFVTPPKPVSARRIKIDEIIGIVATTYQLRILDLKSARRTHVVVRPRQEAMWLCKRFTTHSLPEIGRKFGGRDHTTVLHAVRKIEEMVSAKEWTPEALRYVQEFQDRLNAVAANPDPMLSEA